MSAHRHHHAHDHHGHAHGPHSHGPHLHGMGNEKRVMFAMWLTGSFMVIEAVGGVISGSLALIADAGHMLTDTGALSSPSLRRGLRNARPTARAPMAMHGPKSSPPSRTVS